MLAVACLLLVAVTGCKRVETTPPKKVAPEQSLIIGLIPEQQIFDQVARYMPLADYISKKVGVKVTLKVLSRYGNIIDNFVSMGLDGAFFGSFTYTLAHARLGVEVLARPENLDGISTYHGLIFVRKDSDIHSVKDMQGKRFALVDKATTAGYLLPLDYFSKNGIRDYKTYLREAYFAGTHEDAIHDVLDRKADIGAAKNTIFKKMEKEDPGIMKELTVLERSPDVPENGLAVRKDLDPSVKRRLKDTLLAMHTDPEGAQILKKFGAKRFIETTDRDYEPVIKYAKVIGLNLATYDYMNE
ncbi:MAG: phosphate/phosphite/phosphonate ABC transporter substrate-binding protein [Nitrospirae bacterium]|nr:phosphate/phosphite/phosphonate ABC transporter substrate-binding protein [Nitrospirota bacterium]